MKRKKDKYLPPRVYLKHNAYYFVDLDYKWHRLGKNLPEAIKRWSLLVDSPFKNKTMNAVFDRYLVEISSQKAPATHKARILAVKYLRAAFGHMRPDEITPLHVHKYMDLRAKSSLFQANKEKSVLSHILSCAIRWGLVKDNPCILVKRLPEPKRDRYIEDWEFKAVSNLASDVIKVMMDLAYLTGLRLSDLLAIKLNDITPIGLKVKTKKTRKLLIFEWTHSLRKTVNDAKKLKHNLGSMYLICNRKGQPYTTDGFETNWQRLMRKALEKQVLKKRFHFHDIRRKTATDAERQAGLEYARQLLGHTSQNMTSVYVSGEKIVKPLR